MKNIFRSIDSRFSTLFVIICMVVLLQLGPWMYSSVVSLFAMMDQHTLFMVFTLIAVLGLVFYVSMEARRHLHIPYSVSAIIFGVAGFSFWNMLFDINTQTYLVLGTAAVAFSVFRRGLRVDITGSRKVFWRQIFVGIISAFVLFLLTNFIMSLVFPELSDALLYTICGVLLLLGAHLPTGTITTMGTARFSYDMTILVVLYNFLMFSSRVLPESLLNISSFISLYSAAITSSVYGILVGLIGAYLLHRHSSIWASSGQKKENIYTITLLCGVLALSFLMGANPFIAAGIMGLLVTIRDAKNDPESYILYRVENIINIFVFLLIGASIPFSVIIAFTSFGTLVTVFISVVAMILLGLVFYGFGKMGFLPHAKIKSYMIETYSRHDASIMTGALTLFAISYLRMEYMLLVVVSIMFVIAVEYLYPWILRSFKHHA